LTLHKSPRWWKHGKAVKAFFALRVLACVGLAVTALAAHGPAQAVGADESPVTIRVGVGVNDTSSNFFDAIQLGYFKKHNIDIQVERMTSGASQASALAGGSLDVAESNVVSVATAHLRGLPFIFIAPGAVYNNAAPTSLLVCATGSTIKTGKDLLGKNVGVVALADLSQLGPVAWMEMTGADSSTVHYLEMPAAAMPAALKRGSIEAAILAEPVLSRATADGDAKICANAYIAIAPTFMLNGWITTDTWLKNNSDAARRFREAMLEAAKWANHNHAASATIFAASSAVPLAVIQSMTRATFAERLDPALFQPIINAGAKYKFFAKSFPASEIVAAP
jgi:NitT/TauT family transport system substrate-binding protein